MTTFSTFIIYPKLSNNIKIQKLPKLFLALRFFQSAQKNWAQMKFFQPLFRQHEYVKIGQKFTKTRILKSEKLRFFNLSNMFKIIGQHEISKLAHKFLNILGKKIQKFSKLPFWVVLQKNNLIFPQVAQTFYIIWKTLQCEHSTQRLN